MKEELIKPLATILVFWVQGWLLMLLIGAARSEISLEIPAPGYSACLVAVSLVYVVVGILRESYRSYDR